MRHVLAHITQQDHQLTPQRSLIESNAKQRVQCSGYCGGSKASFVLPWWCFCVLVAGFVVVWRIQHKLWWITKRVCGPWHVYPGWIYFSPLQSVRLWKFTGYSANIEICNVRNIFIAKWSVCRVHWSGCTLKFSWILVHKCNLSQGRNPN
jgi:hypothetical protein